MRPCYYFVCASCFSPWIFLLARKARLRGGRELAVLHGARLVALDARFLALEARGFARVELARFQALLDAVLLVEIALDGAGLREHGAAEGEAERGGDGGVGKFHGCSST